MPVLMSEYLPALWTALLPFFVLIVPGLALGLRAAGNVLDKAAHVLLWSSSLAILTLSAAAAARIAGPIAAVAVAAVSISVIVLQHARGRKLGVTWPHLLLIVLLFIAASAALALPFLLFQHGLPTGDSQKALFWAEIISRTNSFPDYQQSVPLLNRDPVDFFTPGLHALTALFISSTAAPLTAVGLFAIALAVATACVAAATATLLFPRLPTGALAILTSGLLLTNFRFLRYVREPGYHLQNILGELLLFGLMYVGLRVYQRGNRSDVVLAIVLFSALAISHQFSAFIAAFAVVPLLVLLIIAIARRHMANAAVREGKLLLVIVAVAALASIAAIRLGLHQKLPHLFTDTPHLLHLVPTVREYGELLGLLWLVAGLAGILYLIIDAKRARHLPGMQLGWVGSVLALLLLSQGPRIGIDIPPVRALFYSLVPLSISSAFFVLILWQAAEGRPLGRAIRALLVVVVLISTVTSTAAAFTSSAALRTNSTYTPGQTALTNYLVDQPRSGGILVDDYNRRSASWLLLSRHPMYTRIAADISQQMAESEQSTLRTALYLNQLDYEKIFSLGSLPDIASLLSKHHIEWLTGIANSSTTSFQHNPYLTVAASADDITLYRPAQAPASYIPRDLSSWLLKPTTLANDIGDNEDAFEHLPASIRTPRLSEPHTSGRTWRTTTSPVIPLRFNVGDFVKVLWSAQSQNEPDIALELIVIFAQPAHDIAIQTFSGERLPLESGVPVRLSAHQVPYENDGFITLQLLNPTQQPVALDLIALGLSHVP